MEPRIYTYKITFPHQKWWYWGVHKERKYGEEYDGSPVTHKKKWNSFEWEMQILEFFEDWDEARSVERRLIRPDLNNPMCLNENEGGSLSLQACSKGGKIGSKADKSKAGKIGGKISGKISGKIAGKIAVESGQLASIQTFENRSKGGKIMGPIQGRKNVESGQLASISTFENRSKGGKSLSAQRWKCLVTGHISNSGALTRYQKARGIDTSLRERVN